jgi:hypothetical protein
MSTVLIVLILIVVVIQLVPRSRAAEIALAVLVNLLSSELNRVGPVVARHLLRAALVALPASERDDQFDEWSDHLDATESNGIQTLTLALSLVVRGIPRLACRSRLRQTFDVLVPVGEGKIVAVGGLRKDGCTRHPPRHSQGVLQKPLRLSFFATRHPVLFSEIWSVVLIYTVEMSVDDPPEIARAALVTSTRFPRVLSRLVEYMGHAATDRSFAEAKIFGPGLDTDCRLPQNEIVRILGQHGRAATDFVKRPPYKFS